MNPKQALAWVKKSGIAVESARASVPRLAQLIAGGPQLAVLLKLNRTTLVCHPSPEQRIYKP